MNACCSRDARALLTSALKPSRCFRAEASAPGERPASMPRRPRSTRRGRARAQRLRTASFAEVLSHAVSAPSLAEDDRVNDTHNLAHSCTVPSQFPARRLAGQVRARGPCPPARELNGAPVYASTGCHKLECLRPSRTRAQLERWWWWAPQQLGAAQCPPHTCPTGSLSRRGAARAVLL